MADADRRTHEPVMGRALGRIGITSARGWEVVGWVDNATDENWISEESNPNGIVYYGKPRQYGVEMTYRF